jgi:hypothetical protein
MSISDSDESESMVRGPGQYYEIVKISKGDIELAMRLPDDACPRRYCWWWTSLSFEWHLTPTEGCTFLTSKQRPPRIKYSDVPCCRCDPGSSVDHFEPREPDLEEDGIDPARWLEYRAEKWRPLLSPPESEKQE